ncbi:hypothetical protein Tco_1438860 [Tanacetum coccineum]
MLRLWALGSNTESGVPYTDKEINPWLERASSRGTFPVLVGYCQDGPEMSSFRPLRPRPMQGQLWQCQKSSKEEQVPNQQFGSGSGGCGDDEMADDEDGGEDEEDEEDDDNNASLTENSVVVPPSRFGESRPGKNPWRVSPSNVSERQSPGIKYPQRHVARECFEMSLRIGEMFVVIVPLGSVKESLGKVARERILGELSPSTYPERQVTRDKYPQRHVAREWLKMSLRIG